MSTKPGRMTIPRSIKAATVRQMIRTQIQREGSGQAAARKAGLTKGAYNDILAGRKSPGLKVLQHLGLAARIVG